MNATPDTSKSALRDVRASGDDATLRRKIAAALRGDPMTTHELGEAFPDHSANAIRPRVNELLRMGCVRREGKRTNPSGHAAYVHHLTDRGERYLSGEAHPEPGPTRSELKGRVVGVARAVIRGDADEDVLHASLDHLDELQRRMDPEGS